jgi:hypothetical protein
MNSFQKCKMMELSFVIINPIKTERMFEVYGRLKCRKFLADNLGTGVRFLFAHGNSVPKQGVNIR